MLLSLSIIIITNPIESSWLGPVPGQGIGGMFGMLSSYLPQGVLQLQSYIPHGNYYHIILQNIRVSKYYKYWF